MNKKWCRHIVRFSCYSGEPFWVTLKQHWEVPRSWKVCPICQARRPTRANIKFAKLVAAMDNDA